MLFAAAREYNIDLKRSYMIGDSSRDLIAGMNAGTLSVGHIKPGMLHKAVGLILEREIDI
jgi:histidinol phosphatase-like enzyme